MEITANIAGRGLAQVTLGDGQIESVRDLGATDGEKPWVSAGFVDIQINGFAGVDFSGGDLDPEKAASILPAIWQTGVTTFCPTLITNTLERLRQNFRTLERARQQDARFAQSAPAYHLEGPYLSPGGARGAHDSDLMRNPNWDEWQSLQESAGGNIRIVTLAPELPGACEFIERASAAGIIMALGHTDATPEQIHRAIECGARLATHLGNGCPNFIHRHQNPLWPQLASDGLMVSLICDGFHLPPDLVRVVFRAAGVERCILITDAVHVAQLPPGQYMMVGREIELLPSGQVVTMDRQCMAGSALSMNRAIRVFQEFAGASLAEALRAATTNPARLLGRDAACARLEPGEPANLVVFRSAPDALSIESVFLRGRQVFPG
ncbi:MAG TPA: amidohydrolase family protein [Terriglobia bacterium]|nr:amidohydrolase family protein [Terriglobia bacterium]